MIASIVWTILFVSIILFTGYAVWRYNRDEDKEYYERKYRRLESEIEKEIACRKVIEDWNEQLLEDNRNFMKYVPRTELKKDFIITLRNRWKSCREIWDIVELDRSTIQKALKRWDKR